MPSVKRSISPLVYSLLHTAMTDVSIMVVREQVASSSVRSSDAASSFLRLWQMTLHMFLQMIGSHEFAGTLRALEWLEAGVLERVTRQLILAAERRLAVPVRASEWPLT
jgi:predicted neutral ceramidase superfamily lipid hydrolase